MKHRTRLSVLLLATFVVSLYLFASSTMANAATEGYYTYEVSNGEATIIDCDTSISGAITIPSTLGGYPVTSIGSDAFYECTGLTSVTIPDSVINIGEYAFMVCIELTYVTIPNSVIRIGAGAFAYCHNLMSIAIPENVIDIGDSAFAYCTNLTGIYVDAENLCYSSDSVGVLFDKTRTKLIQAPIGISGNYDIPASVTDIGKSAFEECVNLKAVTIPSSVINIGDLAFYYCTGLTGFNVDEDNPCYTSDQLGVLFNKTMTELILAPCGMSGSYNLPDSVTTIGNYAFAHCTGLTSVTIGNGVTCIGAYAFRNCDSLTGVLLPDNVAVIEEYAFYSCDGLTRVTLGGGVTSIGNMAFSHCTNLADVTIPDGVTRIGNYAFSNSTNLTSIIIPNSVTVIGEGAFSYCASMAAVTISNGITSISRYTFLACTGLQVVRIPGNVTSVDHAAFYGCNNLRNVFYCGTETQWNNILIASDNTSLTSAERYYHDWTLATCKNPSMCTICNATVGESLGHSGAWMDLLDPSCARDGLKARICDICGITETKSIPALGHQWEEVIVPPTCTTDGYTTMSCTVCGETAVSDIVPALGHSYNSVITAPTCTEQGYTTITCTVCGTVTITDVVAAKGHGWSAWIQLFAPSCTAEGSQIRFCNCGTKETEVIAKLPHSYADGICTTCKQVMTGQVTLSADMNLSGLTLTEDLYIDLNGFDLSGVINTNGYKVYGMDSTTDRYTCDLMGYFNCVDENGNAIVPETFLDIEGAKRYMTIETENGYSFHRFYLGITKISIAPTDTGFGYKAEFYGDEMVQSKIASIGYNLWMTQDVVVSRTTAFKNTLTLRIRNFDVVNYGQTPVNACVTMTLTDGTVIESATASYSMRQVVEQLNASANDLDEEKRSAVATMIANNPTMQSWLVENIYKKF